MSGPFGSSATLFSSSDFEIQHGAHFNGESNYITRTPSSAGNRRTFTISLWFKATGAYSSSRLFIASGANSGTHDYIILGSDGAIKFSFATEGSGDVTISSGRSLRDPGSWYHLVAAVDTTQGTASNRVKLYINGEQQTTGGSQPSQNFDSSFNNTVPNRWGGRSYGDLSYYNGYMAECHLVDGQQLTPASFGETDSTYGHWKPKQYTGSHGTNGVHLDFQNSGDLGQDASGTGDWTASNFGTQDQVRDTPSNNFPTLNLLTIASSGTTLDNGARRFTSASIGGTSGVTGTMGIPTSGKWYWEVNAKDIDNNRPNHYYGVDRIENIDHRTVNHVGSGTIAESFVYQSNGNGARNSGSESAYGASWSDGDIIGVALDMDNGTLKFYRNNTAESSGANAFTGLSSYRFLPSFGVYQDGGNAAATGNRLIVNFGQDSSFLGTKTAQGKQDENAIGDFYYTPPSGYVALCSKNLPEPAVVPQDNFGVSTWTGNGGTQHITSYNFQPDLSWHFKRSGGGGNRPCFDSVRGATKTVQLDLGEVEETQSGITAFNSDGFTVGSWPGSNQNSSNYWGPAWKCATSFSNDASSTSIGTQDSSGKVNVDGGMSMFLYTGSAGADNMKHGLSKAPTFYVTKPRDNVGDNQWFAASYGFGVSDWITDFIHFDTNGGRQDSAPRWNDENPTSSVLTVGTASTNENGGSYLCYAWHDVDGFSRIGYYEGNGNSDGTYVSCGFQPAFVMVKKVNDSHNWVIINNATSPVNGPDKIFQNLDDTSQDDTDPCMDLISDGFKIRDTAHRLNTDGQDYLFMAFAQFPNKYNNAR